MVVAGTRHSHQTLILWLIVWRLSWNSSVSVCWREKQVNSVLSGFIAETLAAFVCNVLRHYEYSLIVFRICAVRLFFVICSCIFQVWKTGTQLPCACGNMFNGEGVVWQARVCSPVCCQVVMLYRKPSDSEPTSKRGPRPRYRPPGKCPPYRYETTGQLLHSEDGSNQVGCSCTEISVAEISILWNQHWGHRKNSST